MEKNNRLDQMKKFQVQFDFPTSSSWNLKFMKQGKNPNIGGH
jgi:hypothetical protein